MGLLCTVDLNLDGFLSRHLQHPHLGRGEFGIPLEIHTT